MQTILVTGCAGFIGSHVCEQLLDLGYKVIGIDNFDDFYPRELKEKNLSIFKENGIGSTKGPRNERMKLLWFSVLKFWNERFKIGSTEHND